ncbi:MAG TPA: hypothetical protein VGE52_11370, partial [Pirellulales bacterium]
FLMLATSALAVGCSDGPARYPVAGRVTLDGKPLSHAAVVFEPVDQTGLSAIAEVVDGRFEMSAASGPTAGKFHVRFNPAAMEDDEFNSLMQQGKKPSPFKVKIAEEFRKPGKLEAEVKSSGANEYSFAISSKPSR